MRSLGSCQHSWVLTLLFSFLLFSLLFSSVGIKPVWSNSCRQLGASHTLTLVEQLFYPHGLCLRTGGLDLTQWACFVSYQDNACDCWSVWSPECSTHTRASEQSKVKDTAHILLCVCIFYPRKDKPACCIFHFYCTFAPAPALPWFVCVHAYLHCNPLYMWA